jgi:hypothetical protein
VRERHSTGAAAYAIALAAIISVAIYETIAITETKV